MNFISLKSPESKIPFIIETITYITLFICILFSPLLISLLHPNEYQLLSWIELLDLRYLVLIVLIFSYLYLAILSACLITMMLMDYFKSVSGK